MFVPPYGLISLFMPQCPNLSPECPRFTGGVSTVIGRQYHVRQVATLLKLARSVRDPNISAALIDKAADINDRYDPRPRWSLRAPDVQAIIPQPNVRAAAPPSGPERLLDF
jgi:hypothetical protein